MLELWNNHASTCSQKVRIVLAEKGLDWVDRQIDFTKREQISDWYLKINPNGVVPTLVHDGVPVIESSVINEYLDEVFPPPSLVPVDPQQRAEMRAWRQYIDEVPTAAIRVPSFQLVFLKMWASLSPEDMDAYADQLPLRKHFYRKMRTGSFTAEEMEESLFKLRQTIERMDSALAKGGPWLMGHQFTLADVGLIPTIVRMEDLGLGDIWSNFARVAQWYDQVQQRPSFKKTFYPGTRDLVLDGDT